MPRKSTLAGLAVLLVGATGAVVGFPAALATGNFAVVLAVAAVAAVAGSIQLFDGRFGDPSRARLEDTEFGYRVPTPGDEYAADDATYFRRDLRECVVRTLESARECSREEAERLVDDGAWTDDAVAAAYLEPGPVRLPLRRELELFVRGRSKTEFCRSHAMSALEALREGTDG